ncbi:MAG: glycosyltransferase family 2 protein [Gammaproteobacteria bacterium]|nr:glycosyltransferase family 2 protein [Gammaproteobacteria bacterium]
MTDRDPSVPLPPPLVSIVVPTRDRPMELRQALESVAMQEGVNLEIVIVDDGSVPPVDLTAITRGIPLGVRLLRNATPRGIAHVREQGAAACIGHYVMQLDDDDILAPGAIRQLLDVLIASPTTDVVYPGVKGFGATAEEFNRNHGSAISKLLTNVPPMPIAGNAQRFPREVLLALLQSVPMAFQRPFAARSVWMNVFELRQRAYQAGSQTRNPYFSPQNPDQLTESEWTLYAAVDLHLAYLAEPLYLQRCDHARYYSRPEFAEAQLLANVAVKSTLHFAASELDRLGVWRRFLRESYAVGCFDLAYWYEKQGMRGAASAFLKAALNIAPRWRYLRYWLRTLLP